jgi:hypothetical protein
MRTMQMLAESGNPEYYPLMKMKMKRRPQRMKSSYLPLAKAKTKTRASQVVQARALVLASRNSPEAEGKSSEFTLKAFRRLLAAAVVMRESKRRKQTPMVTLSG